MLPEPARVPGYAQEYLKLKDEKYVDGERSAQGGIDIQVLANYGCPHQSDERICLQN